MVCTVRASFRAFQLLKWGMQPAVVSPKRTISPQYKLVRVALTFVRRCFTLLRDD